MQVKISGTVLTAALFLGGLTAPACAADVSAHVINPQAKTLSPDSEIMKTGYYAATTLSTVDTDLAAGNIKSGVAMFGVTGTFSSAPPAPDVGGAWLLVPGSSTLGTMNFWVQKYEARDWSGVPTSTSAGLPWGNTTQMEAEYHCEALGAGYHLVTMPEALTISRNIEANGWNWTGGSVGSGGLWRGHADGVPGDTIAADVTGDPDDDPYTGTGDTTPSIERRVHQLSSGQYLWDWSGNVWEWLHMTCSSGTGAGYWNDSAAWIEWDDANLSDYEKVRAGPAGAYTSAQNTGQYGGCSVTGNTAVRGGTWHSDARAGVFGLGVYPGSSDYDATFGFRCAR